jgi:hypothetical protein
LESTTTVAPSGSDRNLINEGALSSKSKTRGSAKMAPSWAVATESNAGTQKSNTNRKNHFMGVLEHESMVQTMVGYKTVSACEAQRSAALAEVHAMGESRED